MAEEFEAEGLSEFSKDLLKLSGEKFQKETRNFMQRAGNKLRKNASNAYKTGTKQGTKNLVKGLKRGKAYKYGRDEWQVRVKNTAPHAHLVEHGHVMLSHATTGKRPLKVKSSGEAYVKGKNIMGKTAKAFSNEYEQMAEEFIDEMLNNGLS